MDLKLLGHTWTSTHTNNLTYMDPCIHGPKPTLMRPASGSILGRRLTPGEEKENSRVVMSLLHAGYREAPKLSLVPI